MAKTSKKALGATMAGVMALGAVAGTVGALDQVKVANAAESQAQKDAKAKISHTIYSINKNYAGIKNQAQWEIYIKEARALIAKMPTAEKAQAEALTKQVDGLADTVLAIARINQVEKSYEANFHGIKNAAQWREYLDLAKEDMKSVDQSVFAAKYAELVERYNAASDNVKAIEDAYAVELEAATKLYDAAVASMNIEDANKALAAATALGTHATSDALEAKCNALIAEINAKFAVSSVEALNAVEVKVTFNKELDKKTAEDKANYKVDGATLAKDGKLQSDNKSVILRLADNAYSKNKVLALVVDGVQKKDDSSQVIKEAKTLILNDTKVASIVEVTSTAKTNTDKVTVEFDEPVQAAGTYKIAGMDATATIDADNDHKVNLVLSGSDRVEAGKTYTLEVYNEEDFAGTKNSVDTNKTTATKSFTVKTQTSAPSVSSVTTIDDNKVKVVFADDVDESTVTTSSISVLKENGDAISTSDYTVEQIDDKNVNKKEYLVTITDATLYTDKTNRNLSVVVTDKVTDKLGNKVTPTTKNVSLTKDTKKPVAQSVKTLKDKDGKVSGFEISYDKNLKLRTAASLTGLKAINSNGVDISTALGINTNTAEVVKESQNKLTIKLTAAVELKGEIGGNITLVLPTDMIQDDTYSNNKSAAKNIVASLGDSQTDKFTVKAVGNTAGTNEFTVQFSEEVKTGSASDSAINHANYLLNGKTIPSDSVITYDKATKTVTISLPTGYADKDSTTAILTISGIKNVDGSKVVETSAQKVETKDQVKPVLESAKVLNSTTIELTFSENMVTGLTGDVKGEFVIKADGTTIDLSASTLNAANVDGYDNKITITLGTGTIDSTKSYEITTKTGVIITDNSTAKNVQKADVTVKVAK